MEKNSNHNRQNEWSDPTLAIYLERIGETPLLNKAEEIELARKIRSGDEDALQALVRANLRFVVSVAKRYRNSSLSLTDLINEGNIGLMTAARRFDETRGNRFISYAVWWVKQAILKALSEQSRLIRLPLSRTGVIQKIIRETDRLRQIFGREPTHSEVADAVSLSESEIRETMSIAGTVQSLDAPGDGESGNSSLSDYLEDKFAMAPDEELIENRLHMEINQVLDSMSEREACILRSYFGFDSPEKQTLEEIGKRMNISRERVRQIKEQAIQRIRHSSRGEALRGYLTG